MALLSRPLRGTVRRTPDDHSDDDGAPPMKRQRLQQDIPLRRRRSSPDCLDVTATNQHSPLSKARPDPSLKVARPRTATRRARRLSNSSADSIASSSHFHIAGNPRVNGNGVAKTPRALADRDGPSGGASLLLRDARESPDPLDTISPAPVEKPIKSGPGASGAMKDSGTDSAISPIATRMTRQSEDHKAEGLDKAVQSKGALRPKENTADVELYPKNQSEIDLGAEQDQDASARTGQERRSLRSADTGSRCKSELAQYFYNYEQIISLDAPKPGKFEFAPIFASLEANQAVQLSHSLLAQLLP